MKAMVDAAAANSSTDGAMLANQASFGVWAAVNQVPFATANAQLSSITSVESTLTAAQTAVGGTAGGAVGTTFTLLTAADNLAGTANNDTFNAVIDQATPANSTITAADVINGGSGTDTLNVTGTGTTLDVLGSALVSGIEVVNIRATTANTLDASQIAGLTAVNANLGTGTVGVTNLATGASIGVIGNGTVVNGNVSFAYATATAAVTLNLTGGTKAATTVTNSDAASAVTTATINSTGVANAIGALELDGDTVANQITSLTVNAATNLTATLAADDYATTSALTVSGAATAVDLGVLGNFKTINASGLTAGGLTIAGGSNLTSFTGGAGNDVFTTAGAYGATIAATGAIAAGAGTDTLVLDAATSLDSAAEAARYTGFETLRTAGAQDMSLLSGITAVEIGAAGLVTQMNATQAAAVKVMSNATVGATTFALADSAGTSDVLSLTLGTGTTTSVASGFNAAVTIDGFETLNMTTNAGPTATAGANQTSTFTTAFVANKLTTINLYGQSFTISDAATTKATTINASTLTGNGTTGLTLGGNLVAGSTVNASGVADAITLGTVGSTYNLNAGNDAISGTLAQYRTTTTYNTIDGGAGTDTATISGGAALTAVDDDFKGMTNIEKITVATTTTNDQSITTGGWFDANFKAAGVTLTTTSTDGNITIAAGSFTGNMTIVATTADTAGADAGIVTITTGSGNDTVTVSNTGSAAGSISTGAGNDIIVGGAVVETITAGLGADTITGGTGADNFVFGANGSVIGTSMDIITDYATTSDVIIFDGSEALVAADATALVAGSNVNTTAGGLVTFATADNTLALKIAAIQADAQLDAANTVAVFVDGSNSYLYYAGTATGNADDQLIQLSGVTGAAVDTITITVPGLTLG